MAMLLPSLITTICLYHTNHIYRYPHHFHLARSNGCLPPRKYPHKDPFLGLDFFLEAGKVFSENRYLPELEARYGTYGSTFQTNLFGTPSINTIEPENLQAVYLDTSTEFLFGESFGALSNFSFEDSQGFMSAFDNAMFGSGFQIALGPFKFLYQIAKWRQACKTTHGFANKYVQKALKYRQSVMSNALPGGNDNQDESKSGTHNQPLLYHLALQTSNPLTLRNEILQAFMAAQGTTAAFLSNVFFLLARHPSV
ncbi:MAG: hypothetical protein Q9198_010029 [Flavoplaca austrocitrina]